VVCLKNYIDHLSRVPKVLKPDQSKKIEFLSYSRFCADNPIKMLLQRSNYVTF